VKKGTSYFQLVPEKILAILPKLKQSFIHIPGYSDDNLKEILTVMALNIRKDNETGTPLKQTYLRKLVPQADQYLRKLRELLIIERFGFAQIGTSSFKYRFTEDYESKFVGSELTNPKLLRRIDSLQRTLKKRNSKKYVGQNECLRALTILPESLEFIKQIEDIKKYNYAYSSVIRIMNGDISFSVDTTSGRFHSNLTNMPKGLRQFVRIFGIPLANIDVKNCQPYLSTLLLTNPGMVARFAECSSFRMLLETLKAKETEDVKRYVSLVIDGSIYEYLWKEFTKRGLFFESRDEIKKQVYIILFARNIINTPSRVVFKELFPEVHHIFSIIRGNEQGSNFKNFKRFPILLQRIESHIILNLILPRVYAEHPGTIAVTIHDSVMTSIYTDHVEKVKRIMVEEFSKVVGYAPKIKIEGVKEEKKEKEKEKEREKGVEESRKIRETITKIESLYLIDIVKYRPGLSRALRTYAVDYQSHIRIGRECKNN
jgi:hypothetical protein